MVTYKIKIATGTDLSAGTCVQVSIVLVGDEGESAKHQLPHKWSNFIRGAVTDFDVIMEKDLGDLLLVRISTEQYKTFNMDAWYCRYVDVTSPSGQLYQFPFYQWICGPMTVEIPDGKGIILSGNTHPVLQQQRRAELEKQRATHRWKVYAEGVPHCIDAASVQDLPPNDQYTFRNQFGFSSAKKAQYVSILNRIQYSMVINHQKSLMAHKFTTWLYLLCAPLYVLVGVHQGFNLSSCKDLIYLHIYFSHNARGVAVLVKKSVKFHLESSRIDQAGRYLQMRHAVQAQFQEIPVISASPIKTLLAKLKPKERMSAVYAALNDRLSHELMEQLKIKWEKDIGLGWIPDEQLELVLSSTKIALHLKWLMPQLQTPWKFVVLNPPLCLDVFNKVVCDEIQKVIQKVPRKDKPNLTRKEFEAVRSLKEDKDLVIKPADKGGGVVLMKKELMFTTSQREVAYLDLNIYIANEQVNSKTYRKDTASNSFIDRTSQHHANWLDGIPFNVVAELWKEDDFFGSQYLIGVNPTLLRQCTKIPENFPVGDSMVAASLGTTTSLHKELEDGNIFLADYKILQGVPANKSINGKQQYMVAPMCLLWENPQDQLVPIAIQLAQTPGENAPIFLPSDSVADWLLAKMWVRNSEFQVHELDSHLLRTHLFAEVFNIATTRQLPMSHPVYKLIIPHLLYTLEINVNARTELIGPGGYFDQAVVTGNGGVPLALKNAMDGVTYSRLCLPDDIQERGMESIPNYLYRDDGMKIWLAMESFVSDIIHYYYKNDEAVSEDPELQAWVAEIFKEGFLENESSGVPSFLETKASLIKYLTMVIFTCSAQHAAVNKGQFDFYSWMPNSPTSMKSPPPTAKGISTMQNILEALPDVNVVSIAISVVWLLSTDSEDSRRLGHYPDVRFTEKSPLQSIEDFQKKLLEISKSIADRNKSMYFPYTYLDPKIIENSIII
ncbi:arachidonate 12-lipoxygenase, 12R-type-like [Pseudophryne corroboree]|uniref:arachidonate 12-lipoxygenase, 12R-type-like n=1 Tax=Pseudophryne corroboree TaxID=495146 RepID=UPI0030813A4F